MDAKGNINVGYLVDQIERDPEIALRKGTESRRRVMKVVPEVPSFLKQGPEDPFVLAADESGVNVNSAARSGPFPTSNNVYPV